jgi:UDP-N-acetyl-D-mannosaminuronate dehydrogenase
MPRYVTEKVLELSGKGSLKDVKVLLLGVTYKKDVKDLRESPSLDIIDIFHAAGTDLSYHDPYVPFIKLDHIDMVGVDVTEAELQKHDVVVIVTDHSNVDYAFVQKHANAIFDTRCVYKERFANVKRI